MNVSARILVIDDDKKFSFGLVAVLRRAGYQVLTAYNGAEGLVAIQAEKPDIILCDIMMPAPNGIELKKSLASDPQMARIPFLFLTARIAKPDKLVGLKNGADDYITKPFDVDELLERIQTVLRRDELGRQRGLEEASGELERLRKSISTNLSHEIRTPLTVLLSTLDLVVREKFPETNEELARYIKRASSSAYRIKFLVEDLEMLYTIDQGELSAYRQTINSHHHIEVPIDQIVGAWEAKRLQIHIDIHPETKIYAPRQEFGHAVAHLVENACKFSPENGRVTISVLPNGLGGCVIEVTDEGEGIPINLREKVFERYYQISQGCTRQYAGLGIGLTIVRAFAKSMGGDIYILDSLSGCRMRMILPPYGLD